MRAGVSIAEVARRAGVPYTTVWRILTGGAPRIPREVQERVLATLKELAEELRDDDGR